MNILLFILILGVLVFVHELGHFLFAKLFKIRVDEFGFGYPPRALSLFTWKGTKFTLNWIPFGGFVKIFGESENEEELSEAEKSVSIVHKPRWQQALVMLGGIIFNIIFAWILFAGMYMHGVQTPVSSAPDNYNFTNTEVTVVAVSPESPAELAGLQYGDVVVQYGDILDVTQDGFIAAVSEAQENEKISVVVLREEDQLVAVEIQPEQGIIEGKPAIGIALEELGDLQLGFFESLGYAAKSTWEFLGAITQGFLQLFSGSVGLDQVSGPVGIVSQVGAVAKIGVIYLFQFTALLSLNLAILNLVPFPALDGGRLLIILIESIIRRRLPSKAVMWVNTVGFFILIGFMLLVTAKDIIRLF